VSSKDGVSGPDGAGRAEGECGEGLDGQGDEEGRGEGVDVVEVEGWCRKVWGRGIRRRRRVGKSRGELRWLGLSRRR
jgi:hypothetical protein